MQLALPIMLTCILFLLEYVLRLLYLTAAALFRTLSRRSAEARVESDDECIGCMPNSPVTVSDQGASLLTCNYFMS